MAGPCKSHCDSVNPRDEEEEDSRELLLSHEDVGAWMSITSRPPNRRGNGKEENKAKLHTCKKRDESKRGLFGISRHSGWGNATS